MSVNILPIQDGYDTTLTSALDAATGAGGYINVAAAPSATLPVGKTTTVRLDTGNTRAEEIEIDEIDVPNKRLRIKTRNMTQGNGITTSAQTHPAGASCIITFSYAQYSQLFNELAAYSGPLATYADEAARDAANPSPTNGQICYVTGTGAVQIRVGGNWENVATGDDEATTRQCTTAEALNGELFRASDDSNNLHYKDNGGVDRTLLINATGKLATGVYDFATTGEMTAGTDATKPANAAGVKAAVDANAGVKFSATAGASVTAGQAVRFGNAANNQSGDSITQGSGTNATSEEAIGFSTTYRKAAQTFTTVNGGLLTSFTPSLRKFSTPSGNLTAKLWGGAPGSPVLLATSTNTVAETSLTTSYADYAFTFNYALPLAVSTVYGLTVETDRADSGTAYVTWASNTTSVYAGGASYSVNSSDAWAVTSNLDKRFALTISSYSETAANVYPTESTNVNKAQFLGFAINSAAAAASVSVQTEGVATGLSGLTTGTDYYLTASSGAIGTSVNQYFVGRATSATTLDIRSPLFQSRVSNFVITRDRTAATASVTYAHNLGTKPSLLKFDTALATNGNAFGAYSVQGGNNVVYATATPGAATSSSFCIIDPTNPTNGQRGQVTSVDETNVTVSWTYTSGATAGNFFILATAIA